MENNKEIPIIAWPDSDFTVSDSQTVEVMDEVILQEEKKNTIGKKKLPIDRNENEEEFCEKRCFKSVIAAVKIVRETIESRYPFIQILEFRTATSSFSEGLNLLVVFGGIDLETDLRMGFLLSEIESAFLRENNVLCEITYTRKTPHPNCESMIKDYPIIIRA
jgi:hypothetical protein